MSLTHSASYPNYESRYQRGTIHYGSLVGFPSLKVGKVAEEAMWRLTLIQHRSCFWVNRVSTKIQLLTKRWRDQQLRKKVVKQPGSLGLRSLIPECMKAIKSRLWAIRLWSKCSSSSLRKLRYRSIQVRLHKSTLKLLVLRSLKHQRSVPHLKLKPKFHN
jgi:hypothetical protein